MDLDLSPETVALLHRADRAQQEARRLVAINDDWQARVHRQLDDIFLAEVGFRRKLGVCPFPAGYNSTPARSGIIP